MHKRMLCTHPASTLETISGTMPWANPVAAPAWRLPPYMGSRWGSVGPMAVCILRLVVRAGVMMGAGGQALFGSARGKSGCSLSKASLGLAEGRLQGSWWPPLPICCRLPSGITEKLALMSQSRHSSTDW